MTDIRPVETREDIEAVARLAHEIWNDHFPPIIGQPQVDYMLAELQSAQSIARQIREQRYDYFLVFHDGEQAGYFALVLDEDGHAMQLSKLYLRRDVRGRGVGKNAVAFVERHCRARGVRNVWLSVNKYNADSIAFYERVGFATVASTVTDIGGGFAMDDYRMAKTLA